MEDSHSDDGTGRHAKSVADKNIVIAGIAGLHATDGQAGTVGASDRRAIELPVVGQRERAAGSDGKSGGFADEKKNVCRSRLLDNGWRAEDSESGDGTGNCVDAIGDDDEIVARLVCADGRVKDQIGRSCAGNWSAGRRSAAIPLICQRRPAHGYDRNC